MPGTYNGSGNLNNIFGMINARLRGLETQQQQTISNLQGLPVMNFGLIPGSDPPAFGIQFVDPTTGGERMRIGLLPTGEYGISYTDPLGNVAYLLPSYSDFAVAGMVATSTTPVLQTAAGTPLVNAWIGPSGDAYLTLSCKITPVTAALNAEVFLAYNGTIYSTTPALVATGNTSGTVLVTCSTTLQMSAFSGTLTPNAEHKFQVALSSGSATQTAAFQNTSLTVEPI